MIAHMEWIVVVAVLVVLAVLVGHFGLNIAIYNRLNATGLPRCTIKRLTKLFFAWTLLAPPVAAWVYLEVVADILQGRPDAVPVPLPLLLYGTLCLLAWIVLGIPWLIWRPIFGIESVAAPRRVEVIDVQSIVKKPLTLTTKCKLQCRLPLNQIFEISVEEIELPVPGLPAALDGYRIAQLTDIHLTGDIAPEFAKCAVQRTMDWRPDLIALTGDIIDKQICVDWLSEIFSSASAPDGCYYVLGNHDTLIVDPSQTREAMDLAGWTDLGGRTLSVELAGDVSTLLIGNEYPWFSRPTLDRADGESFRFLLSHSPDQLSWARRHDVTLMLAGHTHGGQGRLPLAGPLLSPSVHGSRYASGDFYKPPTTLHVSRGLGGAHLLRINCRPELSLITLRPREHSRPSLDSPKST